MLDVLSADSEATRKTLALVRGVMAQRKSASAADLDGEVAALLNI